MLLPLGRLQGCGHRSPGTHFLLRSSATFPPECAVQIFSFSCQVLVALQPLGHLMSSFQPSIGSLEGLSANAGDIRDPDSIPGSRSNPLQYSCLENLMDRGGGWATVHWLAELDTTEVTQHNTGSSPESSMGYITVRNVQVPCDPQFPLRGHMLEYSPRSVFRDRNPCNQGACHRGWALMQETTTLKS